MLNKKLDKILPKVQKPGRYVGGELNSVIKNKEDLFRCGFLFYSTLASTSKHSSVFSSP